MYVAACCGDIDAPCEVGTLEELSCARADYVPACCNSYAPLDCCETMDCGSSAEWMTCPEWEPMCCNDGTDGESTCVENT